jgi:hypothetical protein
MSKQVRVRYTFQVEKTVTISDETPPKPYTDEEWEDQQIQNAGDELAWAMDGNPRMMYHRLNRE